MWLTLEIEFSDSRGGAISALAVTQRHLGSSNASIQTLIVRVFAETFANQCILLVLTGRLPVCDTYAIALVLTETAPKKGVAWPKYPQIMISRSYLLHRSRNRGCRMCIFKMCFSDSSGGTVLALSVFQGHAAMRRHLGGHEVHFHVAPSSCTFTNMPFTFIFAPAEPSMTKLASQIRAAERFQPLAAWPATRLKDQPFKVFTGFIYLAPLRSHIMPRL